VFGAYRLDADEQVLLRDGQPVTLPPKDLETLLVLVENAGHIVEKEELLEKVWSGVFVEEGNLARHVFNLRQVLGDTQDGRPYIETIPRRGYRFISDVQEDGEAIAPPWLRPPLSSPGPRCSRGRRESSGYGPWRCWRWLSLGISHRGVSGPARTPLLKKSCWRCFLL